MSRTHLTALLALPVALFTADVAAQLDPGVKHYTRVDLTLTASGVTTTSAVLTARTGSGNLTAGDEHWSLTALFVQNLQSAPYGATLELDASAGSQYWGHQQFPIAGAHPLFTVPSVLPASLWTQMSSQPPVAFYASTSSTANFGVGFALVPPVAPSTTWSGSMTWYVLADAAPTGFIVASGTAPTLTRRAAPVPGHARHWYSYTLTPQSP